MQKKTSSKKDSCQNVNYDDFEIFYYKAASSKEVPLHEHDFYELYYFLKGNTTYIVEGHTYFLLPGDILLVSPEERHQTLSSSEDAAYEHIVVQISRPFMEQFQIGNIYLGQCFDISKTEHENLLRMPAPQRQRIENCLQDLLAESFFKSNEAVLAKTCILSYLLVGVNLMYTSRGKTLQTARSCSLVIADVANYINEHYTEPLTMEELSAQFFISKNHLQREFQHIYGISIHQFIIRKRVSSARNLMTDGIPPTEVYLQCGFHDYSNFFRVFKKEYGLSPVEYFNKAKR